MVRIDEIPDSHGQVRDNLAGFARERKEAEPGDDDPDFLPQETLRQTGALSYEKAGVPADEQRSDIFEERLAKADELKAEATAKFKAGEYASAKQVYRRAFHHIDYGDLERLQFAEYHSKMIDDAQMPILLNLAQTALKLAESLAEQPVDPKAAVGYYAGQPEPTLVDSYASRPERKRPDKQLRAAAAYCSTALMFETENVKALYRRGLARERSGNAEDAVLDFRRAKSLVTKGDATYVTFVKALRRAAAVAKVERAEREQAWRGKLDATPAGSSEAAAELPEPEPEPAAAADDAGEDFIAAAKGWEGAKAGYEFKLGEIGLGYYKKAVSSKRGAETAVKMAAAVKKTARPPLKETGVMAERAAKLQTNLLKVMGLGGEETSGVTAGMAFRAFNQSKSGFMSHKELIEGLDTLKLAHSEDEKEMRRLLDRLDVDRDGKVSIADFRNFMGLDDKTDSESEDEDDEEDGKKKSGGKGDTRSWMEVAVTLVLPVYLPGFVYTAGGAIAAPTLTLLAVELGGGKAAAGAALSLRALATLMMQMPAAKILGARGDRQTMFAGGAIATVGALLIAGAATTRSFVLFQISLLLSGLGGALWEVSRQAQMARVIPPHVRGKAVALYGGVVRVGAVGGPILGGLISQAAGQGAVFAVEAVALALAALSTVFVGSKAAQQADDSKQNPKKKKKNVDIRPAPTMLQTLQEHSSRFLTAGVAASLLTLVRMSRAVAVPMIGAEIGLSTLQIGACMSVSSAIEAPLFIPVGWAYDRFGRKPVIIPGIAVVSAAWAALSMVSTRRGMYLAAALLGIGNGILSGANTLTCQDFAPDERNKPNYFALWNLCTGVASMASPAMIGAISSATSVFGAAGVTAGVGAASAAWFALLVPEMKHTLRMARAQKQG